jgi:hypothetical protein
LRGFGHYPGAATLLDNASVIRYSFQDVNPANGEPDGVQDEYKDVVGADITAATWEDVDPLTDDGTPGGVKRAVTKGELLAAVIEYQTFTAADVYSFDHGASVNTSLASGFPYHAADVGAGYVKQVVASRMALKYYDVKNAQGSFEPLSPDILPVTTLDTHTFNSGSTPDEVGISFILPFLATATGVWVQIDASAAGAAWDVILYDAADVALSTISITKNVVSSAGLTQFQYLDNEVPLSIGVTYRLAVKPTTVNNVVLYQANTPSTRSAGGLSGGTAIQKTYRTNAGAWSTDFTKHPLLSVALSHFESDVAAGASGRGFMRGMVR